MNIIFVYGNKYEDRIYAWILSNEITRKHFYKGTWERFNHSINKICEMITIYKPNQIVFDEDSEFEDAIWDAITSKCDNELDIGINDTGKVTYYKDEIMNEINEEKCPICGTKLHWTYDIKSNPKVGEDPRIYGVICSNCWYEKYDEE